MNSVIRRGSLAAAVLIGLAASSFAAAATFNYHGNLTNAGEAANGKYDIQISIYPSATAAVAKAPAQTVYGIDVRNGVFNTEIDLGNVATAGGYVGVAVRKSGAADFEALDGRTALAPDGTCPDAWLTSGNAGLSTANYIGTSDATPLQLGVSGIVTSIFEPNGAVGLGIYTQPTGSHAMSLAYSNGATGDYSIAAGFNAGTVNTGSIVIADHGGIGAMVDTAPDQFIVSATGGAIFNGNAVHYSGDDLVVYPRISGGDDDADLTLVSRNGSYGRMYESNASGILYIDATNGVHVSSPVEIADSLSTKNVVVSGNVQVSGNASKSTAGAWKANSDMRIKQNIESIPDALATLQQIHPVTFEYTDAYRAEHPEIAQQRYYNVIAQEFRQVFPDAVAPAGEYLPGAEKSAANEILQVDTYPAQIVTIAAVQELAQKNDDLAQQNAALKRTVDKLVGRIEKLEAAQGK